MSELKIKAPSGRTITVGKATYKKLIKEGYVHNEDNTSLILGQQNKILNPESRRPIAIGSFTYKKLIK